MATFLFLVQLFFTGTLIVPAYTQVERCDLLQNATAGNFTVSVTPKAYKANTTYLVTINYNTSFTDGTNVTEYLLQAVSPEENSTGEWQGIDITSCSSIDTAKLSTTEKEANWTSPGTNISSVEIRAYIIFTNQSVWFHNVTLQKESEPTTNPPTTTRNSVSVVQSSSFFIAVVQLLLLLATSKLLS